jgi:fluoroacetyl-CoA thioesterase
MKPTLAPGLKFEVRHRVVTQELLSSIYPDGPAVFATPWLLSLMEQAAAEAIVPHLDPGATVVATAEVTTIEKNLVTFHIEARDDSELAARGTHVRAVIDMGRFMRRVKRKAGG